MPRIRQTTILVAVAMFVGAGLAVYELSWYASDVVIRVLLAMSIPACAASIVAGFIPKDEPTERYYDPYPAQKQMEEEDLGEQLPSPPPTSQDKLNFKQNSSKTITL